VILSSQKIVLSNLPREKTGARLKHANLKTSPHARISSANITEGQLYGRNHWSPSILPEAMLCLTTVIATNRLILVRTAKTAPLLKKLIKTPFYLLELKHTKEPSKKS
jgi:hypothetical protein